jgi:hypothetical protein
MKNRIDRIQSQEKKKIFNGNKNSLDFTNCFRCSKFSIVAKTEIEK